jgi:flagellar hook-basal body complex protein FliE
MNIARREINPLKIMLNNEMNLNIPGKIKDQSKESFVDIFKDALESANSYQKEYEALKSRQIMGEDIDIHSITIAGEKAKLSLELTLQIRNKAMEAYQEIMRMQI